SKKRGPKVQEMPNQSHFTHILQALNEINSSLNSQMRKLLREQKSCKHNGTLGMFRCDRCRNRKLDCLIQCIECYKKNKDKKDYLPQCSNCKVTRE
ncbi:13307_t:CDS:2, partial [Gigaspora rosea]